MNAPQPPAIGTIAPDFTLPATGGTVTLSALRGAGSVLIAFFPLAFTGTCTAELCAFGDDYAQFVSRDVTVVPVSVDAVPSLREYKTKHAIGMELASDFHREVSGAYGVLNTERFYANRAYFLVDTSGHVRWSHVEGVNGDRRQNDELIAAIAALRD